MRTSCPDLANTLSMLRAHVKSLPSVITSLQRPKDRWESVRIHSSFVCCIARFTYRPAGLFVSRCQVIGLRTIGSK